MLNSLKAFFASILIAVGLKDAPQLPPEPVQQPVIEQTAEAPTSLPVEILQPAPVQVTETKSPTVSAKSTTQTVVTQPVVQVPSIPQNLFSCNGKSYVNSCRDGYVAMCDAEMGPSCTPIKAPVAQPKYTAAEDKLDSKECLSAKAKLATSMKESDNLQKDYINKLEAIQSNKGTFGGSMDRDIAALQNSYNITSGKIAMQINIAMNEKSSACY